MKYVRLSEAEKITIIEMRKYHPKLRARERVQMIELSDKGKSIDEITEIIGKNRDTVSKWFNSYEKYGISGILDNPKSGRSPKVKDQIKDRIIEIAKSDQTSASLYITEIIENEFSVKLHPNTVKYHLKKRKVRLQANKKQPKVENRCIKI